MHILVAVVKDMATFLRCNAQRIFAALLSLLPDQQPLRRQSSLVQYQEHLARASRRLPAARTASISVEAATTSIADVMWTVVATDVYLDPSFAVDTKVGRLPVAEQVRTGTTKHGWVWVETSALSGWVLVSVLTSEQHEVTPHFADGDLVDSHSHSVRLVREYIQDEFAAATLGVPLLDIEYAYYRVLADGKRVVWPTDRPRRAGRWQHLLRGKSGIHISVTPATGSILEYTYSDGESCLAYVEAVYPDNRITLAGVYAGDKTHFSCQTFTHDVWREWRPVFITFS